MTETAITIQAPRRAPRYFVCKGQQVPIHVERQNQGLGISQFTGRLLDISSSGIRFIADTHVESGEETTLRIASPAFDFEFVGIGTIRWIRPARNDEWQIGASLSPEFPPEILEELCVCKVVERRDDPRIEADIEVQAHWETDRQPTATRLVNFSRGGLCLATSEPRGVGYRVRIFLNDPNDAVLGRALWTREENGEHLVGCEVIGGDAANLRKWTENPHLAQQVEKVESITPWQRLSEWAALIAVAVSGVIVLLLPH